MLKYFWLLLLLIPLACFLPSESETVNQTDTPAVDRPAIQSVNLKQHLDYLSAPERRGRAPGTPAGQASAQYIVNKFKEYGLKPGGANGDYLQPFDIKMLKLGENNSLSFKIGGTTKSLKIGVDFLPLNFSAGRMLADILLVEAGFGITAPEFQYDDYRNKEVKDKVVLIMSGLPESILITNTRYSDLGVRVLNAQQRGAKGVIILLTADPKTVGKIVSENAVWENHLPEPITKRLNSPEAKQKHLTSRSMTLSAQSRLNQPKIPITIPVVLITNPEIVEVLSKSSAGDDLVSLQTDIADEVVYHTENVIGILSGAEPEAVILGAHYDHLGVDADGDIFPGANDNASGVAGLLELVRACREPLQGKLSESIPAKTKQKRTLVFIAFGGEELGLYGSRYYTEHPVVPLNQTVAMLNMDMIAVPKELNQMYLIGGLFNPELAQAVKEENKNIGLTIKDNIDFVFKFGSDHYSFHQKKVPSIDFTTGPFGAEHTVQDTSDKVQPEMAKKIIELVLATALRIADSDLHFPEPKNIEVPFPTGGKHPGAPMPVDKNKSH